MIQWNGHRVFGVLAMSRSIGMHFLGIYFICSVVCRLVSVSWKSLFAMRLSLSSYFTNEESRCYFFLPFVFCWLLENM